MGPSYGVPWSIKSLLFSFQRATVLRLSLAAFHPLVTLPACQLTGPACVLPLVGRGWWVADFALGQGLVVSESQGQSLSTSQRSHKGWPLAT